MLSTLATYLVLPFALIPIAIKGEHSSGLSGSGYYAGRILNIAYSPILDKLSLNNPYRAQLVSFSKSICKENPGRCISEN